MEGVEIGKKLNVDWNFWGNEFETVYKRMSSLLVGKLSDEVLDEWFELFFML